MNVAQAAGGSHVVMKQIVGYEEGDEPPQFTDVEADIWIQVNLHLNFKIQML